MVPCKHVDYAEGKYGADIELSDCAPHSPEGRFWRLGKQWTNN